MRASTLTTTSSHPIRADNHVYGGNPQSASSTLSSSRQLNFPIQHHPRVFSIFSSSRSAGVGLFGYSGRRSSSLHLSSISSGGGRHGGAIDGGGGGCRRATTITMSYLPSAWDDKPYEVLSGGKISYLDEQDVVSFLDPPKQLIPLDPSSYNPAAYLWKKIGEIPDERRHRLLSLLKSPRLVSRAWEIAGTKYEDPKLANRNASSLLSNRDGVQLLEFWNCRSSGGPLQIAWINFFTKALFSCKNGKTYGRFIGGSVLAGVSNSFPLYFTVRQLNEVMSTEQPCDLAYEFGEGVLDLDEYPQDFPKPAKHPWPFNDQVVVYIRHVGPGVMVGQAWQEGEDLQQIPKKLCGEILMVKDYTENH